MSVAVIGLLPNQIQTAKGWDVTRHLGVHYVPKDRMMSSIDDVVRKNDAVVMMTKFINHKIQSKIPPTKRRFVDGGLTKLREQLELIYASHHVANEMSHVAKVTTEPKAVPATPVAAPVGHPDIHLTRDQYSGRVDWNRLVDLEVGQRALVPVRRGEGISDLADKTYKAIWRYRREYGLLAKVTIDHGKVYAERLPYADAPKVVKTEPATEGPTQAELQNKLQEELNKLPRPIVQADTRPIQPAPPKPNFEEHKGVGDIRDVMMPPGTFGYYGGQTAVPSHLKAEPLPLQKQSAATQMNRVGDLEFSDLERSYWNEAFMILLARMGAEDAGNEADKAVDEIRRRFNTPRR